ncbi:hypothetical protein EXIGLDRAFT_840383 [Exidia glandulosa HHB12029]|uniref:Uncharacterized protein n=1 Tax=Exidia glandulosa HHB12029 TaxID=1314781 RepID=A0A165EHH6_EXIGL|nr:hypothetical protein EXIGLDRAFT_840383 [Exidia glandulosa HHB12029]
MGPSTTEVKGTQGHVSYLFSLFDIYAKPPHLDGFPYDLQNVHVSNIRTLDSAYRRWYRLCSILRFLSRSLPFTTTPCGIESPIGGSSHAYAFLNDARACEQLFRECFLM